MVTSSLVRTPSKTSIGFPAYPAMLNASPDTGGAPSSGWLSEGAAGLQGGWLQRTCCGKGTCCVVGASSTDDTSRGLAVSGASSERVVDWLDSCYGGGWAAGHCAGGRVGAALTTAHVGEVVVNLPNLEQHLQGERGEP